MLRARTTTTDMIPFSSDIMITRIKEFLARYDLTQADPAKMVGVRRETVLYVENGKYNPSLKFAHEITVALHSIIDELFIWDEDTAEKK